MKSCLALNFSLFSAVGSCVGHFCSLVPTAVLLSQRIAAPLRLRACKQAWNRRISARDIAIKIYRCLLVAVKTEQPYRTGGLLLFSLSLSLLISSELVK